MGRCFPHSDVKQLWIRFVYNESIMTLLLECWRSRSFTVFPADCPWTSPPYAVSSPPEIRGPTVVSSLYYCIAGMWISATMGTVSVDQGAQHTALRGAGSQTEGCGRMGTYSTSLGAFWQEVSEAVADSAWPKSSSLLTNVLVVKSMKTLGTKRKSYRSQGLYMTSSLSLQRCLLTSGQDMLVFVGFTLLLLLLRSRQWHQHVFRPGQITLR